MIVWSLKAVFSVLVAIVLAVASAWLLTGPDAERLPWRDGAWRTSDKLGNAGDGPYLRASLARIAWFSNDPDRSIYYEARMDSSGNALDLGCVYRISGATLPARWWSVTAYRNFHWVANPNNRYSYTNTNLAFDSDGGWRVFAAPKPQAENWLPTGGKGRLSFVLRLYDPTAEALAQRKVLRLPQIERVSCS
jgi:hypothetical protein